MKGLKRSFLIAILLIVCSVRPFAQQDMPIVDAAGMIDGAEHPELVPDSTAYRLYFIVVSETPNPSDEQKRRQLAHLRKIGLGGGDLQSLISALETFKLQYTDLIARYNESAEEAINAGAEPDINTFLLQRDGLVQSTRDKLKSLLTPEGLLRLDALVQAEKKSMKVPAKETR